MEFTKKLCIYMFKLSHLFKYSPFNATHLSRLFFRCSKQLFNLSILMPFSAFAIFCFTSSILANRFPLRTFFIGETNKQTSHSRQDRVNGEDGVGGSHAEVFLVLNY